ARRAGLSVHDSIKVRASSLVTGECTPRWRCWRSLPRQASKFGQRALGSAGFGGAAGHCEARGDVGGSTGDEERRSGVELHDVAGRTGLAGEGGLDHGGGFFQRGGAEVV